MTGRKTRRRSTRVLRHILALVASVLIATIYLHADYSSATAATESGAADPPTVTRFLVPAKRHAPISAEQCEESGATILRLPTVSNESELSESSNAKKCDGKTLPTFLIQPRVCRRAIDSMEKEDRPVETEVANETPRERLLRILSSSPQADATDPTSDPKILTMIDGLRLSTKVAQQADAMVQNAIRLARLGASHSARAEFTQALRLTAQGLDAQIGQQVHSQALAAGLIALDEAEDFAHPLGRPEEDLMLKGLVAGHKTRILKDSDLSSMPPLIAMQEYYRYAYRQLSIAGGEEAAASKALFALAKLDDFQADRREVTDLHKSPRLISLYQAALTVFPQNSQAANELGVQLAATGQMQAAGQSLRHGLQMAPSVTLWRNLAEVHRGLGEEELARKAENESRRAAQFVATPATVAPRNLVQWVSPAQFARSAGPQNMTPVAKRSAPETPHDTIVR